MLLKLKNVSKFYYSKGVIATGFNKINIEFDLNEFVVITGESGSGKSTLLNVISGLDSYEEGEMYINGKETSHYREIDFENYRKKYISNIFQNFNLVNSYTVYQNIELVLLLNGCSRKDVKGKVLELIKKVNLTRYKNTVVSKLSGGQKQRVAIARALAKDTPIIVCDEPTGNLDTKATKEVLNLLKEVSENKLVIIVTHDYPSVESLATRVVEMHDGRILSDKKKKETEPKEIDIHESKQVTLLNMIRLGIRNTFNIIPKFILLFLVFLFITVSLLSEYAGMRKSEYEASQEGYNDHFVESSDTRIVIKKSDKSIITEEDIAKINSYNETKNVIEYDSLLDEYFSFDTKDYNYYLGGLIRNIDILDGKLDVGVMPQNSNEVVAYVSNDDYYFNYERDAMLKSEFYLYGDTLNDKIKIVGIKFYKEDSDINYNCICGNDEFIDKYQKIQKQSMYTGKVTLNGKKYDMTFAGAYEFNLAPSNKVKKGEAYVFDSLNFHCKNYNCKNSKIKINVKNIYIDNTITLKITNTYDEYNSKKLLNITKKSNKYQNIYINEEDYNNLFENGIYQMSVFANNKDEVDSLNNKLTNDGYKTLVIRDSLYNENETVLKVLKIIKLVVTIALIVTLFFISYFVIKLILKSRNVYFSTIRILGCEQKNVKKILDIELFANATIAYLAYLVLIYLVKIGVLNNTTIIDILSYLHPLDYVLMYLILIAMSYLISTRYASKIFKTSAMKSYKEEV